MKVNLSAALEKARRKEGSSRRIMWDGIVSIHYCDICQTSSGPIEPIQHGPNSWEIGRVPEGWVWVWKGYGGWKPVCPTCPHKGKMRDA